MSSLKITNKFRILNAIFIFSAASSFFSDFLYLIAEAQTLQGQGPRIFNLLIKFVIIWILFGVDRSKKKPIYLALIIAILTVGVFTYHSFLAYQQQLGYSLFSLTMTIFVYIFYSLYIYFCVDWIQKSKSHNQNLN